MRLRIPAVETANHRHLTRIRRPYTEAHTLLVPGVGQVRAQLVIGAIMPALVEKVKVFRAEQADIPAYIRWRAFDGFGHNAVPSLPEPGLIRGISNTCMGYRGSSRLIGRKLPYKPLDSISY